MNFKAMFKVLGKIMVLEGILMTLPLIISFIYKEDYIYKLSFLIPIVILIIAGVLLRNLKPKRNSLYQKEGFALCALTWILMTLFGAIPFVISKDIPNYIDAAFETMSGFTTTGASILDGVKCKAVTELAKSTLFWRSFTHWIGGMGILVFILNFIPESEDGSALHLLKAESPGPQVGKITSKMKMTTRILYLIYLGLTILEVIILLFDKGHIASDGNFYKMGLYESLLAAFGSAGTGGFGFVANSFEYLSPFVQYVTATFLILFGINFSLYFLLLIGRIKEVFRSEELKAYFGVIIAGITVITTSILVSKIDSLSQLTPQIFEKAFRDSYFQTASIMTTTGYSSVNYDVWPNVAKVMIVILMFTGAMAGSTGGGIKVSRIVIAFKGIGSNVLQLINPRYVSKPTFEGKTLEKRTIDDVFSFIAMYMIILVLVVFFISIDPVNSKQFVVDGQTVTHGFASNFTAVLSCISNIGPGLEAVGPYASFANFSYFSKLLLAFTMLIGRLEILPVLILFTPRTWRS